MAYYPVIPCAGGAGHHLPTIHLTITSQRFFFPSAQSKHQQHQRSATQSLSSLLLSYSLALSFPPPPLLLTKSRPPPCRRPLLRSLLPPPGRMRQGPRDNSFWELGTTRKKDHAPSKSRCLLQVWCSLSPYSCLPFRGPPPSDVVPVCSGSVCVHE